LLLFLNQLVEFLLPQKLHEVCECSIMLRLPLCIRESLLCLDFPSIGDGVFKNLEDHLGKFNWEHSVNGLLASPLPLEPNRELRHRTK
jgi:hypothetical protein